MMENSAGIYIHIPFCVKKCNYCAFLSFASDAEVIEKYIESLHREIEECKANLISVDSVYFGGGTPSLLTSEKLGQILNALREKFPLNSDLEITLEANPGTLGKTNAEILKKLCEYRNLGINRLSFGVQSMNNEALNFLGRIHNAEDARNNFVLARKAGFDNINVDLMLSVPFVDNPMEYEIADAEELIKLKPEHISCYSLQIEEDTPFGKMYAEGILHEISDELDRKIYHKICEILKTHGYEQYEISNFAKSGFKSRHNSKYWNMTDYLGLGLGASSFVNGVRYKNTGDMREYLRGKHIAEKYKNTMHDNISEAVFTGLRRNTGIKYNEIFTDSTNAYETFWNYYATARQEVVSFVKTGHLIVDFDGIRLTETGIDISNKIMSLFV